MLSRLPLAVALALPVLIAQSPNGPTIPQVDDANPELLDLVIHDQWERGIDMFGNRKTTMIDFEQLAKNDSHRLEIVRKMLAGGNLQTGKDYRFAALVFQHSLTSTDYLLAHILAVTAVEKGDLKARWLAAATMDRYLQSVGQAQVFGTQFSHPSGNDWSQKEPYDRAAVSDSIRSAWCVVTQAEQDRILNDVREGKPFRSTSIAECK